MKPVELSDRGPDGRFIRGNRTAKRARGTPKKSKPTLTAQQLRLADARRAIRDAAPEIIGKLREQALEGDTTAASLLLRHGLPQSSSETTISGAEHIADMEPEDRLIEVARLVARGDIPAEHGEVLSKLAHQELESRYIRPLKRMLQALKSGHELTVALKYLAEIPSSALLAHDSESEPFVRALVTDSSSDD